MTGLELANTVGKLIDTMPHESLVSGVYFNPMFSMELEQRVEELVQFGFRFVEKETEGDRGRMYSSKIMSTVDGNSLDLGTLLLDGKNIVIVDKLVPVEVLLEFIRNNSAPNNNS